MSEKFTFVCSDELRQEIQERASELALNQSEIVRRAVSESLRGEK